MTDNRDKILNEYRKVSVAEWSLRLVRGAAGNLPFVGGVVGEILTPLIDGMGKVQSAATDTQREPDSSLLIASGAIEPNGVLVLGRQISGVTDGGLGDWTFTLGKEVTGGYIVHATAEGADAKVVNQTPTAFGILVTRNGVPTDAPLKFLALSLG